MATPQCPFAHFAGIDWAKPKHHAVILNPAGQIVAAFDFEHSAAGWQQWREQAARYAPLAVAIETSQGPVIDQLLQTPDCTIYPLNPKAAQRYRERKAPSGTKTDRHDAWSMADALRTDGHGWVQLMAQDEATTTLRLLCRDEQGLIEQRTVLVNQLQAALGEYYTLALESFEDWTKPFAWAFVRAFPTPQALSQAAPKQHQQFLHAHKLWRPQTAQQRLAVWSQGQA